MRVIVIPMKPLRAAKERLASALTPPERATLSLAMLADVVRAARDLAPVWILHSDDAVAALAEELAVVAVADPAPGAGLNASVAAATTSAIGQGADGVLVCSADLPSVTSSDLEEITSSRGVAAAPDRAGTGTNALWRSPGTGIEVAFGDQSLAAHTALARRAGIDIRIVERAGLALDVDRLEDLAAAWILGMGPSTRRAFTDMGLPTRLRIAG